MRVNVRDHPLNLKRDKLLDGSVQAYRSVLIHERTVKDVPLKGRMVTERNCKRKKRGVKYHFTDFYIHHTSTLR